MEGGEDWVLRPVKLQYCKYESLKDGTLDLEDVALLNELADVDGENQLRMRAATEK